MPQTIQDAFTALEQGFAPQLNAYQESRQALELAQNIIRHHERTIIHLMRSHRFAEPFIRKVIARQVEWIYDDLEGPSTRIRIIDNSHPDGIMTETAEQYEQRTGRQIFY